MSRYMARGCHRTGVKRGGGNRQNDFVIDGEEGTCSIVVSTNRMCALYISSSYLKKKMLRKEQRESKIGLVKREKEKESE